MTSRIDKNAFLAAVSCPTQGWYVMREPGAEPTPALRWRSHVGAEIERLAREVLGTGVTLSPWPVDTARLVTADALAKPQTFLAYEATFANDHFVARADAVRRNANAWDIIEFKSGKLPAGRDSSKVKSDYIDDLAFTSFVAETADLRIAQCLLVLVNGEYRHGQPPSALLADLDVTDRVRARAREFALAAPAIAQALNRDARPEPDLILACKDCPFYATKCIGAGIHDPLFFLPRLSAKRFEQFKPYGRITALPADAELTEPQRRVASVIRSNEPLIEPEGVLYLDTIVWPVYYLDFEGIGTAIPWFPGVEPYEQMPFQFSIHVASATGVVTNHHEYLAANEGDWRRELALRLVEQLGDSGSILMYSPYEDRMLGHLARSFPDLADKLNALKNRLLDLEPVFKNGYCHPGFRGRTSIKKTLPALVNDLGYDSLEVRQGDDAAGLFALMRVGQFSSADRERHRKSLLEYCKLDTLAMVRLHQALAAIRATLR